MCSIVGNNVQEKTRYILGLNNGNGAQINMVSQSTQNYPMLAERKHSKHQYHPYNDAYMSRKFSNTSTAYVSDLSQPSSSIGSTPVSSPESSMYSAPSTSSEPKPQLTLPSYQYGNNPFRQLVDSVSDNLGYNELNQRYYQLPQQTESYFLTELTPLRILSLGEVNDCSVPEDLAQVDTTAFRDLILATPVYPLPQTS